MAHMGGAGTVSFPQCIHFMVKAAIIPKETLFLILYLLLCFLMFLFFHTLSLYSFPYPLLSLYLHYVTVRQWDIICIKQYYQLNEQLSYSLIYLEEESESFWKEQKTFSSPTTSVTFVSCALIEGFLVSFVVPPQMIQQYFWKTDSRNNGVSSCMGLRDTRLGCCRSCLYFSHNNEVLICPPASPNKSCSDWLIKMPTKWGSMKQKLLCCWTS